MYCIHMGMFHANFMKKRFSQSLVASRCRGQIDRVQALLIPFIPHFLTNVTCNYFPLSRDTMSQDFACHLLVMRCVG